MIFNLFSIIYNYKTKKTRKLQNNKFYFKFDINTFKKYDIIDLILLGNFNEKPEIKKLVKNFSQKLKQT